jgi:hypothetical protein
MFSCKKVVIKTRVEKKRCKRIEKRAAFIYPAGAEMENATSHPCVTMRGEKINVEKVSQESK